MYYFPFYQGAICTLGLTDKGTLLYIEEGMVPDQLDLIEHLLAGVDSVSDPRLKVVNEIVTSLPNYLEAGHIQRLQDFKAKLESVGQGGVAAGATFRQSGCSRNT